MSFRNAQVFRRFSEDSTVDAAAPNRGVAVVADGHAGESTTIKPILERYGFGVVEADSGPTALDLILRVRPQLVVAALDLPGIDGYELYQKTRTDPATESTAFIFISPKGVTPDKLIGHETYVSDYVQRPISLNEFESRLSAVLRAHPSWPKAAPPSQVESKAPVVSSTAPRSRERLVRSVKTDIKRVSSTVPSHDSQVIEEILAEFHAFSGTASPDDDQETAPAVAVNLGSLADAEKLSQEYVDRQDISEPVAKLYREAYSFLLSSMDRAENGTAVEVKEGMAIANRMAASVQKDKGLLMLAMDRVSEFSLAQHSINVAIIGTRIAQTLEMPETSVVRICLAGILHDLGTVKMAARLLFKSTPYSPADRAEIQKRPGYSAKLVGPIPGFDWLPEIIIQVYERENGQGYPLGLKGADISVEAIVLGIADVFEAYIHHRPHRRAMTAYRALQILTTETSCFPPKITKALIRGFSVYPYNENVVLNTSEIATVIDINVANALRPIVRLLYAGDGSIIPKPKVIDLTQHCSLYITRAITQDELPRGA